MKKLLISILLFLLRLLSKNFNGEKTMLIQNKNVTPKIRIYDLGNLDVSYLQIIEITADQFNASPDTQQYIKRGLLTIVTEGTPTPSVAIVSDVNPQTMDIRPGVIDATKLTPALLALLNNDINLFGYYFGANQSSAITRVDNIATYHLDSHTFEVNDYVDLSGATQGQYNGLVKILSVPDADHFTFAVTGNPTTPSTGTSKVGFRFFGPKSQNVEKIESVARSSTGKFEFTFVEDQTADGYAHYGVYGSAGNTNGPLVLAPYDISPNSIFIETITPDNVAADPQMMFSLVIKGAN